MKREYVLPIMSSSLSYSVAILLAIAIEKWNWPGGLIYGIGFLGVLAASVYAIFVEKKHVDELEKTAQTIRSTHENTFNTYVRENRNLSELIIKVELENAATKIITGNYAIRTNIFLPDKSDGKLFIAYSYGMQNAPDLTIRLATNAGCAGHAYHFGEPAVADLVDPADKQLRKEWKLENDQISMTCHLKAILAIPIRHPINSQEVVGVLNLDSTDSIASIFSENKIQEGAQHFALIIGSLLWLGNIIDRN